MNLKPAIERGISTWALNYPPGTLKEISLSDLATDVAVEVHKEIIQLLLDAKSNEFEGLPNTELTQAKMRSAAAAIVARWSPDGWQS